MTFRIVLLSKQNRGDETVVAPSDNNGVIAG